MFTNQKNKINLISTDSTGSNDTQFKGNYNQGNEKTYINDLNNDSTTDLIATLGHETQHNIDDQTGTLILNDKDQNNYADNFGEDLSFYTENALDHHHAPPPPLTHHLYAPPYVITKHTTMTDLS